MPKPLLCQDAAAYRIYFNSEQEAAVKASSLTAKFSCPMDRLLSPLEMDALLNAYGRSLQIPHLAVAGSLFAKMLGRTLTGLWKLFSVHNLCVHLSLSETTLVWSETEMTVSLFFPDEACTPLPQPPEERSEIRDKWLQNLIDGNLRPLLEALSFRCGLSQSVLWENVFIYLHHGYSEWIKDAEAVGPDTYSERISADYADLTRSGSPFHIPSSSFENPLHPGVHLRIRRTCCLKFALPNGTPCYSCPNICNSKRKEIYSAKK
jgi:ferric iron reductase protein FhuF